MTDKYIKGLFITERTGQYGKYLSIGLSDEAIRIIKELPKNEKGMRNFFASPQKNDPTAYSAKIPVPKGEQAPSDNSPVKTDDLPF